MSSKDNLKAAFTGESMANRTYLAFAKKSRRRRISSDSQTL